MSIKHTPEPWMHLQYDEGIYTQLEDGCRGTMVARVPSILPTHNANAARIVACVNAMAGIENPEDWAAGAKSVFENIRQERDTLKAQNEQLLGAFETCLESWIACIYGEYDGTGKQLERELEPTLRLQALLEQYKSKGGSSEKG